MNIQAAKKYLSLGMRPSQIASILGVSPGRISQLALEYKDEIETLSQIVSSEDVCDGKIETAKGILLDGIINEASSGQYTLTELARAYEIITRSSIPAKVNKVPVAGMIFSDNIVQISVSQAIIPTIHMSDKNEVLAVGERDLIPLPSSEVSSLFQEIRNEPRRISAVAEENS